MSLLPSLRHRLGSTLSAMALALAVTGCGGGGTPTSATPTPTSVTQTIQVLNSDGTSLGTATFTANTGTSITLTMQSLKDKGIDTGKLDPNYFALRAENQGDRAGALLSTTTTGVILITPTGSVRVLWGMNAANGADYGAAMSVGLGKSDPLAGKKFIKAGRLTKANNTNPLFDVVDQDITDVVDGLALLNSAWILPNGIRLDEVNYDPGEPSPDIRVGLGSCPLSPCGGSNSQVYRAFIVTPTASRAFRLEAAVEEAHELTYQFNNLFRNGTRFAYFRDEQTPVLLPVAFDYIRFGALFTKP